MTIDNQAVKKALAEAMKRSSYDCADWDMDVLESLALEILVTLGSQGMFIIKLV